MGREGNGSRLVFKDSLGGLEELIERLLAGVEFPYNFLFSDPFHQEGSEDQVCADKQHGYRAHYQKELRSDCSWEHQYFVR